MSASKQQPSAFRIPALVALAIACVLGLLAATHYAIIRFGNSVPDTQPSRFASADGPLRMEFADTMDHLSVEEALSKPAELDGTFSWEGNTLVFAPAKPLEKDATYRFGVEPEAKTAAGEEIGRPLEFVFRISGNPIVSSRIPAPESTDIRTDSRITIVFDRPVIALDQVGKADNPAGWDTVTIEPRTPGRWRWLSTYAAEFVPASPLKPSQLYTVHVPAGLTTLSGEKTESDATWSFETARPAVQSVTPPDGYIDAGPTTTFTLIFNEPVDLRSVSKHVEILKLGAAPPASSSMPGGSAPLPSIQSTVPVKSVSYGRSEDAKGVLREDRTIVIVTPGQPLEFRSSYALRVTAGVQSDGGGNLGSKDNFVSRFATVGPFNVEDVTYQDQGLRIAFTTPVSSGSLLGTISIEPKVEGWEDLALEPNAWEGYRSITLFPGLKPGTAYTITVDAKASDIFDQRLPQTYTKTITTPDLRPEVEISSKGEFGVFERSKPPVFYLRSVNVKALEVDLVKLTLPQFLEMRKQTAANYDFTPSIDSYAGRRHWTLQVKGEKNQWGTQTFDLQEMLKTTPEGGIYAMTVKAPEAVRPWDNKQDIRTQYFVLTNTALTLKYSGNKALLWAVDMQTGAPVAGANVQFLSLDGKMPVTGTTDTQGFFDGPIPIGELSAGSNAWQPEFWVTANKGNDFSFVSSRWTDPVVTGDFGMWWDFRTAESPALRPTVWVQTDRPVYRPGDTVSFKGFARLKDWNGALSAPQAKHSAEVTIQDPQGTEVFKKTLTFSEFGTFNDTLPTTETSAVGQYSVLVTIRPEGEAMGGTYAGSFQLLAYRKPEYRVELTPRSESVGAGDTVTVDLAGSYYFGAPLAGANVQWRAQLQNHFFNAQTDEWYSFAPEDVWCWWDCPEDSQMLTQGSGTLDAAGKLTIDLPANIADKKLSQVLTIEADVTDPSNQTVSGRTTVIVHKSDAYVGIRTTDYVVTPGQSATVKLLTLDRDGKPLPRKTVTVTLQSRTWNTIRRKNVDGAFYYENETKDETIRTQTVTTDANGIATANVPVDKGGQFVIRASVEDNRGRTSESTTSVYAWSSAYVNWPHTNTDRIDIVVDSPEYKVGDTAKLLVKSPFQGDNVKALVTVERENVITRKVVPILSNAQSIDIPITEDLIPNAYVSVVIIKPRKGETFDENGLDTGAPSFKIGYAQLKIETSRKELTISMKTDKERYLPGEKVTAVLKATDHAGKPARAELSLAAVDASVLALTGYVRPDLVSTFYTQHGLGVYTAPMLQFLMDRFKPGSKGGGGGLEDKVRDEFRDTAFWLPAVVTDAKGEATVTFTLPDNLTTWQLLAVGATKESQFGAMDKEVLSTKRVILRPVRPRFAVTGDRMTLKAVVHNFLTEKKTFTVSLAGTGFTLEGPTTKDVTLNPDESATVAFPATVTGANGLTMRYAAVTTDARDEVVESIPTFAPGTMESTATWGSTDTLVQEAVRAPGTDEAVAGSLTVSVSPSLATYLPGGLSHVTDFPYGCAEQTASAFLPNVALDQLQGLDAFEVVDHATLQKKVMQGLQTLYSFQRADGGFGYWTGSPTSFAPLSAYVVYALHGAQNAGYAVDANVMARATNYLATELRRESPALDTPTRAYILYVLSEIGKGDANLALNLFEKRKELPVFAKAQLAMALQKGGSSAAERAAETLLAEITSAIYKDGRGAHVEEPRMERYAPLMQTNQRATAVVLRALLRLNPEEPLIQDMVRWLLTSRRDGHWDTTQSTTETLLAFTEYLRQSGELNADYVAGVEMNGKMVLTRRFNKDSIREKADVRLALEDLKRGETNELKIGKDGTGKLYYDMLLSTQSPRLPVQAHEEGMSVTRAIRPVSAAEDAPSVRGGKTGELYAVTLTMTVPQERHSVAVESPLPAGLEAIDTQLQTTAQTGDIAQATKKQDRAWWYDDPSSGPLWYFSHREIRDDRVFLFADTLPAGTYRYTYLVRATTPGTFQTRATRIWQMYQPEIFGSTAGEQFIVGE